MNSAITQYWGLLRNLISGKQEELPKLKEGKWKEFNKHAILIAEGHYQTGQKHGRWREYFDTGELMLEEDFYKGTADGRFATYHRNGKVLSEGNFIQGLRMGEFKIYDEQGIHIKSLRFERDVLTEEVEHEKEYANEK